MPETHLLRHIDRFVELDGLKRELVPFYCRRDHFNEDLFNGIRPLRPDARVDG